MSPIPFLDLKGINDSIAGEIGAAMERVVAHGRFINGPEVGEFEAAWAGYCGVPSAVGAANGTSALHAILQVLGIGPGDEVILPSHTFIATAESIMMTGARPVFAEIDAETWVVDAESIRGMLSARTRAIVPVHLYGMPADMEAINAVAAPRGIPVVEDASQAHGAVYQGRRAGALGLAAAFSFFPGKNLGAFGDAGGITTLDEGLAQRMRLFVNHGRESKFEHEVFGTNYRLDTLQAAILLAKLAHLDRWIARRRELAAVYRARLSAPEFTEAGLQFQRDTPGAESAWHLFVVRVPNRDGVREALGKRGIATGLHYPIPCHLQPSMAPVAPGTGSLPVTEELAAGLLSLPLCPTFSARQVEEVCGALKDILQRSEVKA